MSRACQSAGPLLPASVQQVLCLSPEEQQPLTGVSPHTQSQQLTEQLRSWDGASSGDSNTYTRVRTLPRPTQSHLRASRITARIADFSEGVAYAIQAKSGAESGSTLGWPCGAFIAEAKSGSARGLPDEPVQA